MSFTSHSKPTRNASVASRLGEVPNRAFLPNCEEKTHSSSSRQHHLTPHSPRDSSSHIHTHGTIHITESTSNIFIGATPVSQETSYSSLGVSHISPHFNQRISSSQRRKTNKSMRSTTTDNTPDDLKNSSEIDVQTAAKLPMKKLQRGGSASTQISPAPHSPPTPDSKISFLERNSRKEFPKIYLPNLHKTFYDEKTGIKRVEFGKKIGATQEKVILLVGGSGSGKSTLINGIANYVYGVEWSDDYRLKLIDDEEEGQSILQNQSQTQSVTSYTIHPQPWFRVPFTLTLIDTPGFGDTSGMKKDEETTQKIRKLFSTIGSSPINNLDAVGFVLQSSLVRLTPTQRYIFDSVLSLFGKNIADNIFMLLTFAGIENPQVVNGIREANISYKNSFKFNNSALYAGKKKNSLEEDEDNIDEMFWKVGAKSFKKFMSEIKKVEPKSLIMTREVLKERKELEIIMSGLQRNIRVAVNKLQQQRQEINVLRKVRSGTANRGLKYNITEQRLLKVNMKQGEYAITCTVCRITCHEHCTAVDNDTCTAMSQGRCRVCPKKCLWELHSKGSCKYDFRTVTIPRTADFIRQKYQVEGRVLPVQQLIRKITDDLHSLQSTTIQLADEARMCLTRLNEIALKPNPLSSIDYIDLMIEEEKTIAHSGWKETVAQLETIKEHANVLQETTQQGHDPIAGYKAIHNEVIKKLYEDIHK